MIAVSTGGCEVPQHRGEDPVGDRLLAETQWARR